MKNKFVLSLILSLVWLSVCGVTCHPYDDISFEDICWNNFECIAFLPEEDSVWMELFSGDSLLDIDSTTFSANYSHLPNFKTKYDFRERFTLRIHVFCNGEWLDDIDFEFENRTDKFTRVELYYVDGWHTGSSVTRIFTDEQLTKCPELAEYRIFVNTEHPPSCFDPS